MAALQRAYLWRTSRRKAAILLALCGGGLSLTGCGSRDTSQLAVAIIAEPEGIPKRERDQSLADQLTRAATAQGLVAFDEQGRVVPALADRWIVTDDGQSYIFRLRDGEWRDGEPLTSASAKAALDRAIAAQRGTPLALDLAVVEDVRVMAGRVVEIRLVRPMPNFLQLMAQPELGLVRNKQGDGPMLVETRNGVSRFTPIEPSRLGLPEVPDWEERTRQLTMVELPAAAAVKRFNDGEVDLVLGGRIQDFPLTSSVGILRGTIQLDPVMGLFGLQVTNDKGFLAEPQNREALALAIDRGDLIAPFGVSGWSPTNRLVAAGLEGDLQVNGERWVALSLDERRAIAAERVQRWRNRSAPEPADAPGSDGVDRPPEGPTPATGAPTLAIWLPPGPGADILYERIAASFRAVGIDSARAATIEASDLRMVDEVARFPRARWFLNELSCAARRGLCDPEVDGIVAGAAKVVDASQRAALLGEAEARLTQTNIFIPFGSPIRWSLARGNLSGFASNTWGWHPLMPLAWLPK